MFAFLASTVVQDETKIRELLKNPPKFKKSKKKNLLTEIEPLNCRMRQSRIMHSMQHTQGDTKERELLKCVVAVKECIRGGGRHIQDVIFKH